MKSIITLSQVIFILMIIVLIGGSISAYKSSTDFLYFEYEKVTREVRHYEGILYNYSYSKYCYECKVR